MSLKYLINSLDDVAEPLREFYTKRADGKFALTGEGIEDVTGLKTALERERENVRTREKAFDEIKAKFSGIDLDEYTKLKEAQAKVQADKVKDKGNLDEIVAERLKVAQAAFEKERDELTQRNKTLSDQLSKELIENAFATAAAKYNAHPGAFDEIKLIGLNKFKVNEQGQVVAYQDGKILYGKDPSQPLTIDEFVGGMPNEKPYLFKGSTGANTPGNGGSPVNGNGKFSMTKEQAKNDFQAYKRLEAQAMKEGQHVTVTD